MIDRRWYDISINVYELQALEILKGFLSLSISFRWINTQERTVK